MKKIFTKVASVAVAASALVIAGSASAGVVSPVSSNWTLQTNASTGQLSLFQTSGALCDVNFSVSVDGTGNGGSVPSGNFSNGTGCGSLIYPDNFSWSVTFTKLSDTTAQVTIHNIYVFALAGYCQGNLVGIFDETTQTVDFASATVPGKNWFGVSKPCTVDGVMELSGPSSPLLVN